MKTPSYVLQADPNIDGLFPSFSETLRDEIKDLSEMITVASGDTIIREGQYLNAVPIVIKGLVKVYISYKDKELLLYYLQPSDSCIMTFNSVIHSDPSLIYARTEKESNILMLPVQSVTYLLKKYPSFNELYYSMYHERYTDLLHTITQSLFEKMDQRLHEYLKKRAVLTGISTIKMTQQQIADELGTAREVVSRMLKKLESENVLQVDKKGIHLNNSV